MRLSVCVRFSCVHRKLHIAVDCSANNPERFSCSTVCLRAVLISSPDTWDGMRMQWECILLNEDAMRMFAVMHRQTLCANVDSAKIKMPIYTTDIDIMRVSSMHRTVRHRIDVLIHINELLHPYWIAGQSEHASLLRTTSFVHIGA